MNGFEDFGNDFGGSLFEDYGLADVGGAMDQGIGLGDLFEGFQDVLGTVQDVTSTVRQVQQVFDPEPARQVVVRQPMPQQSFIGGTMPTFFDESGNGDFGGGGMVQTGGIVGGAVAAGGIWLGSFLARALGRGAASAVFTAANGIRVRLSQLWPLIRRYGPQNVAGALGITVGALGTLAMQAPRGGARRRSRGISARDVKTTSRTIRQLKKLVRMSGIRMGGGSRSYRSYRPRRSYGGQHRHW